MPPENVKWWKFSRHFPLVRACIVIAGGFLVHLSLGTLYTFGNLAPYIVSYIRNSSHPSDLQFGTSTWIYALSLMGQGGSMFFGGWLSARIGPRWSTLIGSWLMSAGVLLSYLTIKISFWLLLLTYGVMFGLGVGIGYVAPLACAMRWLPRWKGIANGVVVAGFGFGALIFDFVQTSYINPDNLAPEPSDGNNNEKYFTQPELLERVPSVFLVLGGTYAVMQLIGSLLLANPPEEYERDNISSISSLGNGINSASYFPVNDDAKSVESTDIDKASPEVTVNDLSQRSKSPFESLFTSNKGESDEEKDDDLSGSFNETSDLLSPQRLIVREKKKRDDGHDQKSQRRNSKSDQQSDLESSMSSWTPNVITSLKPTQMLRKLNFYHLWFMFASNGMAVVFTATLYKFFALTFIDDDHFLALVGSIASVFNCTGRIIWGVLADKVSYKFALVLLGATMTAFHLTFYATIVGGKPMLFIWVCVIFFCIGGNFTLFPTAIGRTFGPKYVATNYGLLFSSQIIAGFLEAILSQFLIHRVQWYGLMFLISGVSSVGFVLALLYRPKRYIVLGFSTD